jgi:LacI family transcriptional regulator
MADIARKLDVSRATVSYVLNEPNTDLVGAAMRERVLATAREMGYRPNRAAQTLKGRPSHIIQVCVNDFYPAFYARALHEIKTQIAPTPYELYIVHPKRWADDDYEKVDSGWPMDGVIVCDSYFYPNAMAVLKECRIPIVTLTLTPALTPTLTATSASTFDVDHVCVDLNPALLEAMHHLAAHRNRVAFLSPWEINVTTTDADPRYHIYRAVMKKLGRAEEIIVCPHAAGLHTRALAREVIRNYVRENGCPEAIFCFNDERAIATLDALRALNYRVPQDVLLIGCDDIDETDYHSPKLSTIRYPFEEAARLSWEFLQRRMTKPDTPLQSATLTAELVLRESSASWSVTKMAIKC